MLENLEILKQGLDVANSKEFKGFNLEGASVLLTAYVQLKQYIEDIESAKPDEETPELKKK